MAPPSNEFLKSEVDRLTKELEALKGGQPQDSPIDPIKGLYKGKNAMEWCEAFDDAQRTIERLKKQEPSEGQSLADIMKYGRESVNEGVGGVR